MNRIEWEWRKNARCEKSDSRSSNGKVHRKLSEWNPFANAIRITLSSSHRFVFSVGFFRCFLAQTEPMTSSYFIATVFHCPYRIVSFVVWPSICCWHRHFSHCFFFSPSVRLLRRDAIIISAHRMVRSSFISFLAPQEYVHTHTHTTHTLTSIGLVVGRKVKVSCRDFVPFYYGWLFLVGFQRQRSYLVIAESCVNNWVLYLELGARTKRHPYAALNVGWLHFEYYST